MWIPVVYFMQSQTHHGFCLHKDAPRFVTPILTETSQEVASGGLKDVTRQYSTLTGHCSDGPERIESAFSNSKSYVFTSGPLYGIEIYS